jgi:solute carrier family 25, member 39/40
MKITRTEGVTALWRGLPPTLLMAVPATVIYFVGYESIRASLEHHYQVVQWAPLISGGLARSKSDSKIPFDSSYLILVFFMFAAISASIISPIELIRTRLQSGQFEGSRRYQIVLKDLSQMVRHQGALALWKGLSPTLWRDIPFSGRQCLD